MIAFFDGAAKFNCHDVKGFIIFYFRISEPFNASVAYQRCHSNQVIPSLFQTVRFLINWDKVCRRITAGRLISVQSDDIRVTVACAYAGGRNLSTYQKQWHANPICTSHCFIFSDAFRRFIYNVYVWLEFVYEGIARCVYTLWCAWRNGDAKEFQKIEGKVITTCWLLMYRR